MIRKSAAMTSRHAESRSRRTAILLRHGWRRQGEVWINPRTGRRVDIEHALLIEDVHGTFLREFSSERRDRDRTSRGTRPSKAVSSTLIEAATILA